MSYPKILTVQDISCVGQCSLTVALPVLSACGAETCILPSAVLSTHTAGFTGFTCRDLTEDFLPILTHWKKEGIVFDAVYTGYLGSTKQIELVKTLFLSFVKHGGRKLVDPAMADNGKLYPAFNEAYVSAMKGLCAQADVLLPNLTEACFLTDMPYRELYDETYVREVLDKLSALSKATIVLTGIGYRKEKTGVVVYENGDLLYYEHEKIEKGYHGTGDVYASAFTGALMQGKSVFESAKIAADYVVECIRKTQDDPKHTYGVKFELALPSLIKRIF